MAHLIVRYVFRSPGKIKVVHLCHKAEPQTKLNTAFLFQKDRPTDSRNPSRFTTSEKKSPSLTDFPWKHLTRLN